jgi:DNA-binding response OmpR family regulator
MTPKPTVLVVTPDPNMRNLLQEVLQADSWEVEAADGIADAWEQVIGARSAFNLVVIDLLLPEVDIEVTVHQMRQKVGEGLDILFVSPCGGDGLAHRAQRLGGRHLLGPLNLDDLRFQAKAALRTSAIDPIRLDVTLPSRGSIAGRA